MAAGITAHIEGDKTYSFRCAYCPTPVRDSNPTSDTEEGAYLLLTQHHADTHAARLFEITKGKRRHVLTLSPAEAQMYRDSRWEVMPANGIHH